MRNRSNTLLWMKDLIEHMSRCQDQLEWTHDRATQAFLAESLLGDLSECQKLCETLRTAHCSTPADAAGTQARRAGAANPNPRLRVGLVGP